MAEVKTIKGVTEETWAEFKGLASRNDDTVGSFFEKLIAFYKKESKTFWDDILGGDPIITEEEAKDIEKEIISLRKQRSFRDDLDF